MSVISVIAIIVLVACFIVGLVRGILKTLLRFLAIIATALLTVLITPYVAKAFVSIPAFQSVHPGIISGISALIITLILLGIFSFIIFIVNKRLDDSSLSSVNRVLGGFFYAFVGLIALILVGYVINIFRDAEFMRAVIANSQKDAFANWLVTNNLFNKFMEAVAKEGSIFWQFVNGFRTASGGDSIPSGDGAASGEVVAKIVGAIASI